MTRSERLAKRREQRARAAALAEAAPWPDGFLATVSRIARQSGRLRRLEHDVVKDIAQDIVLFFLEKIRAGQLSEPPEQLQLRVVRLVRQFAWNRRRSRLVSEMRDETYRASVECSPRSWMDPDLAMRENAAEELRSQVIERLAERRREIFLLVRDENLSYAQAGAVLGIDRRIVSAEVAAAEEEFRRALPPHLLAASPWRRRGKSSRKRVGR